MTCFSFRPLPLIGQGVLRFAFIPAQLFPRGPLKTEMEGRAQISRCASGAGGRTCQRYRLAEQQDRYRVRGANLARLASGGKPTTESRRRSGAQRAERLGA